jgi:hypothetical protein
MGLKRTPHPPPCGPPSPLGRGIEIKITAPLPQGRGIEIKITALSLGERGDRKAVGEGGLFAVGAFIALNVRNTHDFDGILHGGRTRRSYPPVRVKSRIQFWKGGASPAAEKPSCCFPESSLSLGAKLWSAAACCRFPLRELARGDFTGKLKSQPASWLEPKRQQAAVLQSFASAHLL